MTRIALAALALGLLATAPASAQFNGRANDQHEQSGGYSDGARERQERATVVGFLNSLLGNGPYGGGSAHGPHANGGSGCACSPDRSQGQGSAAGF